MIACGRRHTQARGFQSVERVITSHGDKKKKSSDLQSPDSNAQTDVSRRFHK